MTYAESSDRDVWVERFGSPPVDELLFTVRNESTVARPYRMTIDLAGLSPVRVQGASATEVLSGTRLQAVLNQGKNSAVLSDTIQPNTTRVLQIDLTP